MTPPPLLHRIRWSNVARAAVVAGCLAMVIAWPRLGPAAPEPPPAALVPAGVPDSVAPSVPPRELAVAPPETPGASRQGRSGPRDTTSALSRSSGSRRARRSSGRRRAPRSAGRVRVPRDPRAATAAPPSRVAPGEPARPAAPARSVPARSVPAAPARPAEPARSVPAPPPPRARAPAPHQPQREFGPAATEFPRRR